MKKQTLLYIGIVLLVVLNLLQIGASLLQKHPPRRGEHPPPGNHAQRIAQELNLSKDQLEYFEQSIDRHRQNMDSLSHVQKDIALQYFNDAEPELLEELGALERDKIRYTEMHFKEVESFLNAEQKKLFPEFQEKALRNILR